MSEAFKVVNSGPQAPLEVIGVVTRDRPHLLHRLLASLAMNAASFGRRCRLVVADDSQTQESQEANRAAVRDTAAKYPVSVSYATRSDKERYAIRLADAAGVPRDIVRFALLGDEECDTSYGANRNTLVLDQAGERFVMLDDDVLASFALPDAPLTGLSLGFDDPTLFRFFEDRQAVLDGVHKVDVDLLALYGEDLGRGVLDLVREAGPDFFPAARAPALLKTSQMHGATISVSLTGTFGDTGIRYGTRLLWSVTDEARADLLTSEAHYRLATRSREVLRVARRKSIIRPAPFHTTTVALDTRTLLPPFPPVLRGEDRIFGVNTSVCCPQAFAMHLPYAMLHAPEGLRTYETDWVSGAAIGNWDDVALAIMVGDALPRTERDVESRLRTIGERFMKLGRGPLPNFVAYVSDRRLSYGRFSASTIRELVDRRNGEPAYWADDARAHLAVLEDAMASGAFSVPRDFGPVSDDEAWAATQRVAYKFGQLLDHWPRLFSKAQELRERGEGICLPIPNS